METISVGVSDHKSIFIFKYQSHAINCLQKFPGIQFRLRSSNRQSATHAYLLTYLLIYLLTHSLEQSPWEANRFSTSQESTRILWKLKGHYHFNIMLPPTPGSTMATIATKTTVEIDRPKCPIPNLDLPRDRPFKSQSQAVRKDAHGIQCCVSRWCQLLTFVQIFHKVDGQYTNTGMGQDGEGE
jgi:hypothetical protein